MTMIKALLILVKAFSLDFDENTETGIITFGKQQLEFRRVKLDVYTCSQQML